MENNKKMLSIVGISIILCFLILIIIVFKPDKKSKSSIDSNVLFNSNIDSNSEGYNPVSNKIINSQDNKTISSNNKQSNSNDITKSNSNISVMSNSNTTIKSNTTSNVVSNGVKKKFTATFKSYATDVVLSSTSVSCETYGDSCEITTPTFTRKGYNSVGFSFERYQDKVTVGVNSKYTLTKDVTLYASTTVTRTATFNMTRCAEKAGIMEKIEKRSCTSPVDKVSCDVTIPKCTVVGTHDGFWQITTRPVISIYNAYENGSTISISSDFTFEPYTSDFTKSDVKYYKARNFSIAQTFEIGNVLFEYEKGIPKSAVQEHIELVKTYYKRVPFLFKRNITVFVLTEDTYSNYSIAYGLTFPVGNKREKAYIDLKYDTYINAISDNATLHEMAHAWDSYYEYLGKGRISNQSNMINLYNTLIKNKRLDHNNAEWFAGMLTEWYWHYKGYDTSKPSYVGYKDNYSESEKRCAEKLFNCYINLANNNYNGTCSNVTC